MVDRLASASVTIEGATMYRIFSLIDPSTGEIIPFTPALAHQVHEFQALRLAAARAEAAKELRGLGSSQRRVLVAAPANEEDQFWRLFCGGGL